MTFDPFQIITDHLVELFVNSWFSSIISLGHGSAHALLRYCDVMMSRPVAHDVAVRAIILGYVVRYGLVARERGGRGEAGFSSSSAGQEELKFEANRLREEIWKTLNSLRSELSHWEDRIFSSTILTMTKRQQVDALWRIESLQVLLWALGICSDFPPYDVGADYNLLNRIPAAETMAHLPLAEIRNFAQIGRAREVAELWHWRSRMRQLIEEGRPLPRPPGSQSAAFRTLDDIVRWTARQSRSDGILPVVMDEDFVACGKAYRELTADEWSLVRSITVERHHALNWLCGYAPKNKWDETPTGT
ncbi:MAG: DUF4272 domain-containing protein [Alphaproteobacteria bacterium]|nr:DUF4272 domain-containing protein [Alphaproteobacteria bacterium]